MRTVQYRLRIAHATSKGWWNTAETVLFELLCSMEPCSDVNTYRSRPFLTACRNEIGVALPIAARKPSLLFPYRLLALTVLRA